MNSLFKRSAISLLAVAAASTLCAPSRAATASWVTCQADGYGGISEQVDCNMGPGQEWTNADFHNNRLGGGDDHLHPDILSVYSGGSGGDYYDPASGQYDIGVAGGGTYNCWCICSGGSSGGAFNVSTGGTYYVAM